MPAVVETYSVQLNNWVHVIDIDPGHVVPFEQNLPDGQKKAYYFFCLENNEKTIILDKELIYNKSLEKANKPLRLAEEVLQNGEPFFVSLKPDRKGTRQVYKITHK